MKLISYSHLEGPSRVGALVETADGTLVYDLAAASMGYRSTRDEGGFVLPSNMVEFLETGEDGLSLASEVLTWAERKNFATTRLNGVRLLAPIPRPPKILALAGNYQAHIVESGMAALDRSQTVPKVFIKPATTLAGQHQPLTLPTRVSQSVDWELELSVIIGRPAKYVSADSALQYVAGYATFVDISSRALEITGARTQPQPRDKFFDWLNGKWQDGFGLMGPYIATRDEIPDPQQLHFQLSVNDDIRQAGSTSEMIFTVAETVAWASQLFTLEPGDVIAMGTPAGVGAANQTYLRPGDILTAEFECLGTLTNPVIEEG